MNTNPITTVSNAIKDHTKWMENINKCLICNVSPNDEMLEDNAHLKCKFGKWLEENKEALKEIDIKIFYEIYEEHEKFHKIAKSILDISFEHNFMNITKHKTVPVEMYDEFLKLSKDIKKTLRKFRANLYDNKI